MPRVRICSKCLVFKVLGFYRGIKDRVYSRNGKFPWVGLFVPYNMKLLFVRRGVVFFTTVRLLRPWKDHGNNMHFQTSPYFTTPMLTICEQSFLVGRFLVGPTPILSLIDAFAICSTDYRLVFVSDLSVNNKYGQNLSQKFRQLIGSTNILFFTSVNKFFTRQKIIPPQQ